MKLAAKLWSGGLTALLVMFAVAAPASAMTPLAFIAGGVYPTGEMPAQLAAGDLNGDGLPDLAVVNVFDRSLSILLSVGGGSFAARTDYQLSPKPGGQLAVSDLNGDGRVDLVTPATFGDRSYVRVFLGNGTGILGPPVDVEMPARVGGLTVSDLDRDGKPDLALGGDGHAMVMLGKGDGTFGVPSQVAASACGVPAVADFNSDGKPDIATADCDPSAGTISVLKGNGDGTVGSRIDLPTGANPQSLVAGDFDGDGAADLANTDRYDATVSVHRGDGFGRFAPRITQKVGDFPTGSAVADFDGDGQDDIAVANQFAGTVSLVSLGPDGRFVARVDCDSGANPLGVVATDLNGDRRPDLAVSSLSANRVVVFTNAVGSARRAGSGPCAVHQNQQPLPPGSFFGESPGVGVGVGSGGSVGGGSSTGSISPTVSAMPVAVLGGSGGIGAQPMKFKLTVRIPRGQSLRSVLRDGLSASASCSRPSSIRSELRVDRSVMSKAKLAGTIIGRARVRCSKAARFRVRLTDSTTRRRLASFRTLRLHLSSVATGENGRRGTAESSARVTG